MKRISNLALFPLMLLFLSFSFFISKDEKNSSFDEMENVISSSDTFSIVSLFALGKTPLHAGTPDSICIRAVSQYATAEYKSIIVRVFNEENVHCCPYNVSDTCLSGTPKEIKLAEFSGSSIFDTTISFQLGDFGLKENDLIIVSGVYGDTLGPANSYKTYYHKVTKDEWNYADPCLPDTAGIGFSGYTGNFLAGFRNRSSSTIKIVSIDHTFLDSSGGGFNPYKIVVYSDNGSGKPGSLLHLSAGLTTPSGTGSPQTVTYNLNSPINISTGNKFYVGYRQTTGSNIKAAYQNENPVRSKAFFYSSPDTSNTWFDFSDSSKYFRLDISPRIQTSQLNLKFNFQACPVAGTINVELRNSTAPYALVDSVSGMGGGNVSSLFYFINTVNGSPYYIIIKSINSIETWSSSAITFASDTSSYNFTSAISKAYGNNQILSGGIPSVYQGDANQDGFDDGTDAIITNNVSSSFTNSASTDFNCDGSTDLSDLIITFNNAVNFVQLQRP